MSKLVSNIEKLSPFSISEQLQTFSFDVVKRWNEKGLGKHFGDFEENFVLLHQRTLFLAE